MGKIKSKPIKKAAEKLRAEGIDFSKDFEKNKEKLKDALPSKKTRNKVAGYLVRLERQK